MFILEATVHFFVNKVQGVPGVLGSIIPLSTERYNIFGQCTADYSSTHQKLS